MILRHPKDKQTLCHIHKSRVVQLGSCLTCPNRATICEVKGCISHHEENERAHNVITLEQIRLIVSQYLNSASEKRSYLKKMVYEYFTIAWKEVERLFTQVNPSPLRSLLSDSGARLYRPLRVRRPHLPVGRPSVDRCLVGVAIRGVHLRANRSDRP